MRVLDWVVFALFLGWVVYDGMRRARGAKDLDDYYAGGRVIPWWAAGLSIMATQASAITVIGTTGKGHEDGMKFLHTYLGLPIAMVLLCVFFVPMFRSSPILTAYEFLERRFGPVSRTFASLIFLVSRCAALGVVIYAPAIVLAVMTGMSETTTILIVGLLTTAYTTLGGVNAVVWTDVKQMLVIIVGLAISAGVLLFRVLDEMSLHEAMRVVGSAGKLDALIVEPASLELIPGASGEEATSFWEQPYNLWTGLLGGTFLMLAYFGADQSQVQRILTNPTADESRKALLLSAFAKIPMQFGVLMIGVLLWLFHALGGSPVWFVDAQWQAVEPSARASIEQRYDAAAAQRREAMLAFAREGGDAAAGEHFERYRDSVRAARALRVEARAAVGGALGEPTRDVNSIFPHFILSELPVVVVGLLIAAIFAAAMSSVDSVLNSLSAATTVDFYRRWWRPGVSPERELRAGRMATLVWGLFATGAAIWVAGGASIIEQVNKIGSFFYGTLLGVFVLALLVRRAGDAAATIAMVCGMTAVLTVHFTYDVGFLWYNLLGCVVVVGVGRVLVPVFPAVSRA